jgi:hypothetical protein
MEAYARLNTTKRGREITGPLECSETVYHIKSTNKDAYYCPPGATDKNCPNNPNTVFIDPDNNIEVPTTNGMQPMSKATTLGHELGHATGVLDDGDNAMNNVNINENPIRAGFGEPARTDYYVSEIIWRQEQNNHDDFYIKIFCIIYDSYLLL